VTKVINHLPLTRHISVNSPAFFRKNAEILYPTFKVSVHKHNDSMQLLLRKLWVSDSYCLHFRPVSDV